MEIDCESYSTTIDTVSQVFRCSPAKLVSILRSVDVHGVYEEYGRHIEIPSEEYLLNYVCDKLGEPSVISSVCWFHTTRTAVTNSFDNGILPLGEVLGEIWNTLVSLAPNKQIKTELEKLKSVGSANFQYNLKVSDEVHWGPYGILVRDVAFHASDLSQHDYLGMPEIIEDLLQDFSSTDVDLLKHYSAVLVPKIVKFRSTQGVNYALEGALCYAYDCSWGLKPRGWSVKCFDGGNVKVLSSNIIKVETKE